MIRTIKFFLGLLLIWLFIESAGMTQPGGSGVPQLGFGARDRNSTHWGKRPTGSLDYMDLFEPEAPWKNAASHLQVFLIEVNELRGFGDPQLRRIVEDLK